MLIAVNLITFITLTAQLFELWPFLVERLRSSRRSAGLQWRQGTVPTCPNPAVSVRGSVAAASFLSIHQMSARVCTLRRRREELEQARQYHASQRCHIPQLPA